MQNGLACFEGGEEIDESGFYGNTGFSVRTLEALVVAGHQICRGSLWTDPDKRAFGDTSLWVHRCACFSERKYTGDGNAAEKRSFSKHESDAATKKTSGNKRILVYNPYIFDESSAISGKFKCQCLFL